MKNLLNAIKQSIDNENWISALYVSLTLPDICGAMEYPTAKNGKRYKDWCNRYLVNKYQNFNSTDCWKLRNACLHEGSATDTKKALTLVHFIKPEEGRMIHNNTFGGVLQVQIDIFCNDLCSAVEKWLKDINDDEKITANLKNLMDIHPVSSLEPFIKIS